MPQKYLPGEAGMFFKINIYYQLQQATHKPQISNILRKINLIWDIDDVWLEVNDKAESSMTAAIVEAILLLSLLKRGLWDFILHE